MKKILITSAAFILLLTITLIYSCKKDLIPKPPGPPNGVSVYKNENGKFKKEIVVKDESGKNSLFLSISSDNESSANEYITNNDFKLDIERKEIIETIEQNASRNKGDIGDKQTAVVDNKNAIHIEVVTSNLEKNVEAYSLQVNPKKRKNGMSTLSFNAPVDYVNSTDWIGIIQFPSILPGFVSYDLRFAFWYQPHHYLSGWKLYGNGTMNETAFWNAYMDEPNTYLTKLQVATDTRQGATNYKVVYARADFRGRSCPIGSFDGQNCYIGTPPSGTSAFVWGSGFYYTPFSGTPKCLSGATFDGANCYVMAIPTGVTAFVWQNNWYAQTSEIPI
jgi:hypothetical protein